MAKEFQAEMGAAEVCPETILLELESYESQGISLCIQGRPFSPKNSKDRMQVREISSYMRDYVIDDGIVSEIRFDRVTGE